MRILIVNAHRNLVGGVEKYLQAVIPGLLGRGHELGLLHEYRSDPAREQIDPPAGSLRTWCLADCDWKRVLGSVADWKPNIVYFHGLDGSESVALEDALLAQYPVVLYVHNYDRTCATGRKCYSFPQFQTCTRQIGPMCLVLHYPRRCGGLRPDTMWRSYRQHTELNARLSEHLAILVASAHMYREIQRHGVSSDKLHLVPLPSTDVVPSANAPAPKRFTNTIVFVGRLTDVKGANYLIQAIPKAARRLERPLTLTIAGDGPERGKLHEIAERHGATVDFAGWVSTGQKLNLIREADLVAVPSLWPEPFGLVGIEAGSLGVPAVAFDNGGISDWLVSGQTGELAPGDPPTVDGLAESIVRALADPEHYARLCWGAWKSAKRFTLENHLARLAPILGLEPLCPGPGLQPSAPGIVT